MILKFLKKTVIKRIGYTSLALASLFFVIHATPVFADSYDYPSTYDTINGISWSGNIVCSSHVTITAITMRLQEAYSSAVTFTLNIDGQSVNKYIPNGTAQAQQSFPVTDIDCNSETLPYTITANHNGSFFTAQSSPVSSSSTLPIVYSEIYYSSSYYFQSAVVTYTSIPDPVTVFESYIPDSSSFVDFSSPTSSLARAQLPYVFIYRIPSGISFDTIQVALDSSSTTSLPFSASIMQDNGVPFESYAVGTTYSAFTLVQNVTNATNFSSVGLGTYEKQLGSSFTISSSSQFLLLSLDPNTPYRSYPLEISTGFNGYTLDGYNKLLGNFAPSIKLCLNTCPSAVFDNLPSYEVSSPFGNSLILNPEFNTRFLDVDNIVYSSSTQNLSFDVHQFIDPSELSDTDNSRRINRMRVRYGALASSTLTVAQTFLFDATSSTSTVSLSIGAIDNGSWTFLVDFSNNSAPFTGIYPFVGTSIQFDVTIQYGIMTLTAVDSPLTSETPALDFSPAGFYNGISTFFVNAIEKKHPFAWFFQTIEVIQYEVAQPHLSSEVSIDFDLAYIITSATSSGGYFDFFSAKSAIGETSKIHATPITDACMAMKYPLFDTCDVFKTIIGYFLYLALIAFIGLLIWMLIASDSE